MAKRDLDIFAGEYALGTLDAEMRSEAEKLKASDAAFARAVSEWEERLSPLIEAVPPVKPVRAATTLVETLAISFFQMTLLISGVG